MRSWLWLNIAKIDKDLPGNRKASNEDDEIDEDSLREGRELSIYLWRISCARACSMIELHVSTKYSWVTSAGSISENSSQRIL